MRIHESLECVRKSERKERARNVAVYGVAFMHVKQTEWNFTAVHRNSHACIMIAQSAQFNFVNEARRDL